MVAVEVMMTVMTMATPTLAERSGLGGGGRGELRRRQQQGTCGARAQAPGRSRGDRQEFRQDPW